MANYYAHTLAGRPEDEWHGLVDHLRAVGAASSKAAEGFGGQDWANLAGLWHDLGKYSTAFQDYLHNATDPDTHIAEMSKRVDHSTAGAQHAVAALGPLGHLLAYPISGHHSGLLDGRSVEPSFASLENRLEKHVEPWTAAPASLLAANPPELPAFVERALRVGDAFAIAFYVRMLFSCLVDSDFLDTEAFMSQERAAQRPNWPSDVLAMMSDALDKHPVFSTQAETEIDRVRHSVRDACIEASRLLPGLFSLTVPTGGGKTLSSLSFALRHALKFGKQRVIYVAPFTTIIEQNAEVFRRALSALAKKGDPPALPGRHSKFDDS